MTINLQEKVCYRLENQFLAIIPENHREDLAYVFRTIGYFAIDGLFAHAPVSSLRQQVPWQLSYENVFLLGSLSFYGLRSALL